MQRREESPHLVINESHLTQLLSSPLPQVGTGSYLAARQNRLGRFGNCQGQGHTLGDDCPIALVTQVILMCSEALEPLREHYRFSTQNQGSTTQNPSLLLSLHPSTPRHFPRVVAVKWAPSYQVQEKQKMLYPCLRKESEQNRSYFICHKGEWEMCKTEFFFNII